MSCAVIIQLSQVKWDNSAIKYSINASKVGVNYKYACRIRG